jgi:hypothetical protein
VPKLSDGLVNHSLGAGAVRYVYRDGDGPLARVGGDLLGYGFCLLCLQVGHYYVGAEPRECPGDGFANALGRAGDDGDFVG